MSQKKGIYSEMCQNVLLEKVLGMHNYICTFWNLSKGWMCNCTTPAMNLSPNNLCWRTYHHLQWHTRIWCRAWECSTRIWCTTFVFVDAPATHILRAVAAWDSQVAWSKNAKHNIQQSLRIRNLEVHLDEEQNFICVIMECWWMLWMYNKIPQQCLNINDILCKYIWGCIRD